MVMIEMEGLLWYPTDRTATILLSVKLGVPLQVAPSLITLPLLLSVILRMFLPPAIGALYENRTMGPSIFPGSQVATILAPEVPAIPCSGVLTERLEGQVSPTLGANLGLDVLVLLVLKL